MKPREKFLAYWARKMESYELLSLILWSWVKNNPVKTLAKKVLTLIEQKWDNINIQDLQKIKGIWKLKALQILWAYHLGKRLFLPSQNPLLSIGDILREVHQRRFKKKEYLICLTLDGAEKLIKKRVITIWLLNKNLIHPREIFADAIQDRANSIILVHNHPSGTAKPSNEDIQVTHIIHEASQLIWIKLVDHIIVTAHAWFSFKEAWILSYSR